MTIHIDANGNITHIVTEDEVLRRPGVAEVLRALSGKSGAGFDIKPLKKVETNIGRLAVLGDGRHIFYYPEHSNRIFSTGFNYACGPLTSVQHRSAMSEELIERTAGSRQSLDDLLKETSNPTNAQPLKLLRDMLDSYNNILSSNTSADARPNIEQIYAAFHALRRLEPSIAGLPQYQTAEILFLGCLSKKDKRVLGMDITDLAKQIKSDRTIEPQKYLEQQLNSHLQLYAIAKKSGMKAEATDHRKEIRRYRAAIGRLGELEAAKSKVDIARFGQIADIGEDLLDCAVWTEPAKSYQNLEKYIHDETKGFQRPMVVALAYKPQRVGPDNMPFGLESATLHCIRFAGEETDSRSSAIKPEHVRALNLLLLDQITRTKLHQSLI